MRRRRRYTTHLASELPWRIEAGTVLDSNVGPMEIIEVSYSTLRDVVYMEVEARDPQGNLVREERSWDYIKENYL